MTPDERYTVEIEDKLTNAEAERDRLRELLRRIYLLSTDTDIGWQNGITEIAELVRKEV